MRITAKTVPAGETFMTRFPELDERVKDLTTDGKLDESKVRQALRGWQDAGYLIWGDDSRGVIAFAVEFLAQLRDVTRKVEEDATTDAHTFANSAADIRLQRRFDKGKYAYTRFDFTGNREGLRVRVSCANPREIVGTAIECSRRFAVYACRIIAYIRREIIRENPHVRINLEGVGDLADIFEEAEWTDQKMVALDEVRAANEKRSSCPNHVGEYCSPVVPDCRCHNCGKCVEATLPEHLKTYKQGIIKS